MSNTFAIGKYVITAGIQETNSSLICESSHPVNCCKLAIKFLKKGAMSEEQYNNELEINNDIDNDYIMPIIEIIDTVPDPFFKAIVMKKATGNDLLELILSQKRLNEEVAVQVAYAGLMALKYLHTIGICHRDVKPENFFLMDENIVELDIVLADFGHSTYFEKGIPMTEYIIGTPVYSAPEILKHEGYDESVDIWSLGCVIYLALAGRFAFLNPDDRDDPNYKRNAISQIINGRYSLEGDLWEDISQNAKDFIRSTMQVNPKDRPSIDRLLAHPWILSKYVEYGRQHKRREEFRRTSNLSAEQLGRNENYYQ